MGLMDGLAGWLGQIIAVLLMASLIDLLLPNRTMQRYVRLVAGLFILMTVATPVLSWLKGDIGERLADGLSQVERSPGTAAEQLAVIEAEGERLRARRSEQAEKLAAARLASAIRADIEMSEHRAVRSVNIQSSQGKDGGWTVTGVKVILEAVEAEDQHTIGAIASVKEIAPIADIDIRIEVGSEPGKTDGGGNESAQEATARARSVDEALQARVVSLISTRYGVAAGSVEVSEVPSDSEGTRR